MPASGSTRPMCVYGIESNVLSYLEAVELLRTRVAQLANGAKAMVDLPSVQGEAMMVGNYWKVAIAELLAGKFPLKLRRTETGSSGIAYDLDPNKMSKMSLRDMLGSLYTNTQPKIE